MKDVSAEQGVLWDQIIETEITGKKQPDWLLKGDVLFAARGSRNYAVLVDQSMQHVVSAPQFYILRIKEPSILPEFLVWQLNQKPLQNYFIRAAEGTVTKSVRRPILENALVSIPSLEKQNQILNVYKTLLKEKKLYSDLIRNADKLMNSIASELVAGKAV